MLLPIASCSTNQRSVLVGRLAAMFPNIIRIMEHGSTCLGMNIATTNGGVGFIFASLGESGLGELMHMYMS